MTTATIGQDLTDGIKDIASLNGALSLTRRLAAVMIPALVAKGLRRHGAAQDAAWEIAWDETVTAGVPDVRRRACMVQFYDAIQWG